MLKKIADEEYKKKLEDHRAPFMLYLRGEVFLRAAFVRVKGEVAGYLNDHMGIIEYKDEKEKKLNIFFHTDDVRIFKKEIKVLDLKIIVLRHFLVLTFNLSLFHIAIGYGT